ncbi:MAG: hypothetical protein ACT4PT_14350 [Methanobacteriota archaeon]
MAGRRGSLIAMLVPATIAGCFAAGPDCQAFRDDATYFGFCSERDSFFFRADVENHTRIRWHQWENSKGGGGGAYIAEMLGGGFSITSYNARGTRVHEASTCFDAPPVGRHSGPLGFGSGEPGFWSLRIKFCDFTGRLEVWGVGTRPPSG